MIDLLETEIVALRARNQELQLAVSGDRSVDQVAGKSERKAAKKSGSTRKSSNRARKTKAPGPKRIPKEGEQLPLGLTEEEQKLRILGKRQALGKSLVQLRKVAAPRPL